MHLACCSLTAGLRTGGLTQFWSVSPPESHPCPSANTTGWPVALPRLVEAMGTWGDQQAQGRVLARCPLGTGLLLWLWGPHRRRNKHGLSASDTQADGKGPEDTRLLNESGGTIAQEKVQPGRVWCGSAGLQLLVKPICGFSGPKPDASKALPRGLPPH